MSLLEMPIVDRNEIVATVLVTPGWARSIKRRTCFTAPAPVGKSIADIDGDDMPIPSSPMETYCGVSEGIRTLLFIAIPVKVIVTALLPKFQDPLFESTVSFSLGELSIQSPVTSALPTLNASGLPLSGEVMPEETVEN